MTTDTATPPAHPATRQMQPPSRAEAAANRSIRNASLVAGVGLLLMSALAGFANFVVLEGLVTTGDAATTATAISASEGMFRVGVVSWFGVIALDVVVAWALLRVFNPVSASISMLAAWLRLVYAGVFMVAITELVGALRLLGSDAYLGVFSTDQVHAHALLRIEAFTDVWDAGLVLFGLHLLAVGYLAIRSGYVPKLLGVLIGIAGFGYLFDSVAAALVHTPSVELGPFTFIGELLLAVWLVVWGRRITLSDPRLHGGPVGMTR